MSNVSPLQYNRIGILGIYGICVLLGAIPFKEFFSRWQNEQNGWNTVYSE